jgi:hypothetical protein
MLKETEYEVKATADSPAVAEFVGTLEERLFELNPHNIDDLRTLCSEFGFEELLSALKAFDAPLPRESISSIDDETRRRGRKVEEKT